MNKRQYLKAIELLEKRVYGEFMDAIKSRVNSASIKDVEAGIVAQDIDSIIASAGLTEADLTVVVETLRSGYLQGAMANAEALSIQFGVTHKPTADWLARYSSFFVVEISETSRDAIKYIVSKGYEAGANPRTTALDIVGRMVKGRGRVGGVVGLHEQFASYVDNARNELRDLNPNYLTRARRDKRFDKMYERALLIDKPLTQQQIDAMSGYYSDQLLRLRGETIARNESMRAISSGRHGAIEQAIDRGEVHPDDVERAWSATMDSPTRESHALMDKQVVRYGQPFVTHDDISIMYPGDPNAPAAESIQCRCYEITRINHIQAQKRREGSL